MLNYDDVIGLTFDQYKVYRPKTSTELKEIGRKKNGLKKYGLNRHTFREEVVIPSLMFGLAGTLFGVMIPQEGFGITDARLMLFGAAGYVIGALIASYFFFRSEAKMEDMYSYRYATQVGTPVSSHTVSALKRAKHAIYEMHENIKNSVRDTLEAEDALNTALISFTAMLELSKRLTHDDAPRGLALENAINSVTASANDIVELGRIVERMLTPNADGSVFNVDLTRTLVQAKIETLSINAKREEDRERFTNQALVDLQKQQAN